MLARFILLVLGLSLAACQPTKRDQPPDADEPISAETIIRRYNERTAQIERVRARAVIEARWIDADGTKHFEQGDGLFVFRKPQNIAVTIGKLGDVYYWLGCDARRFWWFDMNPNDRNVDTAHVGHHEQAYRTRDASQLLIPPLQLIQLLGVTALPQGIERAQFISPDDESGQSAVIRFAVPFGGRRVTQEVRVGLITGLPYEISFFELNGRLIARAELARYQRLPINASPLGPPFPTNFIVKLPENEVELKINLESITTREDRFPDALFNFEAIVQQRKPQKIVNLDE